MGQTWSRPGGKGFPLQSSWKDQTNWREYFPMSELRTMPKTLMCCNLHMSSVGAEINTIFQRDPKLDKGHTSVLFSPPLIPAGIHRNPQEWTGIPAESARMDRNLQEWTRICVWNFHYFSSLSPFWKELYNLYIYSSLFNTFTPF